MLHLEKLRFSLRLEQRRFDSLMQPPVSLWKRGNFIRLGWDSKGKFVDWIPIKLIIWSSGAKRGIYALPSGVRQVLLWLGYYDVLRVLATFLGESF